MTKSVSLACIAVLAHASSTLAAEPSVTLFGVLDDGIAYTSNIKEQGTARMANGIRWPSYWGIKGTEDLGGGWHATVNLQSAFNANTGAMATSGVLFGRVATAGIAHRDLGQVTLGRQGEFMNDFLYLVPEREQYLTTYAMAPGGLDRMAGGQLSHSIKYRSAPAAGLSFGAMYAFANTESGTAPNGIGRSVEVRYTTPAVKALAVYTHIDGVNVAPASSFGSTSFLGYRLDFGATTPVAVNDLRIAAAGVSGVYGRATGIATYSDIYMASALRSGTMRTLTFGALYRFSRAFVFEGSIGTSRLDASRWHQWGGTLDYFLSPATDIYLLANMERATGEGQTAQLFMSGGPSSGATQRIVQLGIKHYF